MNRKCVVLLAESQVTNALGVDHQFPEDMRFEFRQEPGRAETLVGFRPGLIPVGVYVGDLKQGGWPPFSERVCARFVRMALGYDR